MRVMGVKWMVEMIGVIEVMTVMGVMGIKGMMGVMGVKRMKGLKWADEDHEDNGGDEDDGDEGVRRMMGMEWTQPLLERLLLRPCSPHPCHTLFGHAHHATPTPGGSAPCERMAPTWVCTQHGLG